MRQDRAFTESVPTVALRLIEAARQIGRFDIADQLASVSLRSFSFDPSIDAGYLYVTESRPLNIVEQNVIGVKYGECVSLDALPGIVVVDLDNFGRVKGVELLGYAAVFEQLASAA